MKEITRIDFCIQLKNVLQLSTYTQHQDKQPDNYEGLRTFQVSVFSKNLLQHISLTEHRSRHMEGELQIQKKEWSRL